jgi:hypothetical protein
VTRRGIRNRSDAKDVQPAFQFPRPQVYPDALVHEGARIGAAPIDRAAAGRLRVHSPTSRHRHRRRESGSGRLENNEPGESCAKKITSRLLPLRLGNLHEVD